MQRNHGKGISLAFSGILLGAGLFEALSGAAITFAPSLYASVEFGLVLHVVIGIALLAPFAVYLWSHYRFHGDSSRITAIRGGFAALGVSVICLASGLWAADTAAFSDRVPYVVRSWHEWASYAALILIAFHVIYSSRRKRQYQYGGDVATERGSPAHGRIYFSAWVCFGFLMPILIVSELSGAYHGPHYHDGLPPGYDLKYGPDPFAPSNAETVSGTVMDWRRLANSKSCRACHPQIYAQWESSIHHWSGMDIAYRAVSNLMAKEMGGWAPVRYCGGCHEPAELLSGAYDQGSILGNPGSKEGSSCSSCHGIHGISHGTRGNGNYIFSPARDYLFSQTEDSTEEKINHFLIRAYPRAHRQDYAGPLEASPKLCSTCHKQYISKQVNGFGFVRLQNQYDDWLKGHYYSKNHPDKTLNCMNCHMRNVPSDDPARDSHGFIHSHRFIAANTAIPWLHHDLKQMALTEQWLKGKAYVPEIESRWASGPVVKVWIDSPLRAAPGRSLRWNVVIANNKPGHSFPTGPLDLIQVWLDVTVKDAHGRVIYRSGSINRHGFVDPNAFFLRAIGKDVHDKTTITKHNLWNMVGQKTKRSLFVGFSQSIPYKVKVPRRCRGPLAITARLRYRKFNQTFVNFLVSAPSAVQSLAGIPHYKNIRFPITDLSKARSIVSLKNPTETKSETRGP